MKKGPKNSQKCLKKLRSGQIKRCEPHTEEQKTLRLVDYRTPGTGTACKGTLRAVQCSAVQCNAVQCSAVQCSGWC